MAEKAHPVPVLIVTYNGIQWIQRCLNSLLESNVQVDVFVVDNASTDGTGDVIRNQFHHVNLTRLEENVGFSRANNIGLQKIDEKYQEVGFSGVFLLNQDAYVTCDTLGVLALAAARNKEFGVISPIHLNGSASALDKQFGMYCKESGIDEELLFEFVVTGSDAGQSNLESAIIEIDFVNAAAWYVTSDCLSKVGYFSPKFFMYGEDSEYLNRVRHAGLKVGIHKGTSILHDREHRPAKPRQQAELDFFKTKSLITLLHPSYGNLQKWHIIFDELFKTFVVGFLRNPVLSIRLLFRKLVILMRVIKCAKTPDAD